MADEAVGMDGDVGNAGTGGVVVDCMRLGEERELCRGGGAAERKPLRRSDAEDFEPEDLKEPAMEPTTEGFRLRLTGCLTSGMTCTGVFPVFRTVGERSGVRVYDELSAKDGAGSG